MGAVSECARFHERTTSRRLPRCHAEVESQDDGAVAMAGERTQDGSQHMQAQRDGHGWCQLHPACSEDDARQCSQCSAAQEQVQVQVQ
jgi:hypothetical protein